LATIVAFAVLEHHRLVHLAPVDVVISAFYFALVLLIGFYVKRMANVGEEGYRRLYPALKQVRTESAAGASH
jgi:hypothetical protein